MWQALNRYLLLTDSPAACANIVCAQCTDLGQTAINKCCSQANPQQCFISGGGGNSNYLTTAAPDPNLTACSTALNAITTCEAQTPGFSDLANSDEASCLCYQGGTSWDPTAFDRPWSSCIAWAKTADTTVYSELLGNAGMCAAVGNILEAPAASTATTTGSRGAQASVTSAKATPVGGSQSVATSTSSSTQATSSSAASSLERNIGSIVSIQVSFWNMSSWVSLT